MATDRPLRVAVLGLGEAGTHFANGLAGLGLMVTAWDPVVRFALDPGVTLATSNLEAARHADIVLSVNLSQVAEEVAAEVCPVLDAGRIFAEMNTCSPEKKQSIATLLQPSCVLFADLAIMAPVPPLGIMTPFWVSGPGAAALMAALVPFGLDIRWIGPEVGEASTRKLLRSIVYKGFAAVICEALDAGRAFGMESYIRSQISSLIGGQDDLIDRFESGSRIHALRRSQEMQAVADMLNQHGLPAGMTTATRDHLLTLLINP